MNLYIWARVLLFQQYTVHLIIAKKTNNFIWKRLLLAIVFPFISVYSTMNAGRNLVLLFLFQYNIFVTNYEMYWLRFVCCRNRVR